MEREKIPTKNLPTVIQTDDNKTLDFYQEVNRGSIHRKVRSTGSPRSGEFAKDTIPFKYDHQLRKMQSNKFKNPLEPFGNDTKSIEANTLSRYEVDLHRLHH